MFVFFVWFVDRLLHTTQPASEHFTTLGQLLGAVFVLAGGDHLAVFREAREPAQLFQLHIGAVQQAALVTGVAGLPIRKPMSF